MLNVINPITGAIINTHLRNPFTYRLDISRITCRQLDSLSESARARISCRLSIHLAKKVVLRISIIAQNVAYRLHIINKILSTVTYIQIAAGNTSKDSVRNRLDRNGKDCRGEIALAVVFHTVLPICRPDGTGFKLRRMMSVDYNNTPPFFSSPVRAT